PRRLPEQSVEELRDGCELFGGGFELVHAGAENGGVPEPLRVPPDMLARDASATLHSIESVQLVQVLDQDLADLGNLGRGKVLPGLEEVLDLAEDPRPSL